MAKNEEDPLKQVQKKAEQMRKARQRGAYSPLQGFSAFGVVGWSVAVPTVVGAIVGKWLNTVTPRSFSWVLALMLAGLIVGIIVAWEWVARNQDKNDES